VRGLRLRLATLFVLAVLPGLVAAAAFNYLDFQDRKATAASELLTRVRQIAAKDGMLLGGVSSLLQFLAKRPSVVNAATDPMACAQAMARLIETHREFAFVGVFAIDGHLLCSGIPGGPTIGADRAWLTRALASRAFAIGNYAVGSVNGKPMIKAGFPVISDDGVVTGVIGIAIDVGWLNDRFGQLALERGMIVDLTDASGTVLASSPEDESLVGHRFPPAASGVALRSESVREAAFPDGVTRIFAFAPLGGTAGHNLMVTIGIDRSVLLAPARWSLIVDLTILAGVAFVGAMAAFLFGKGSLLRPIDAIDAAARRLAGGDFEARIAAPFGNDELGHVAAAFNRMADALADRERELRTANEYKSRMLAIAGHDLRQPLQIIALSHDVVSRGLTDEKLRKHLARGDQAIDRLARQLDLITTAGRLEAKALKPLIEPVPIRDMVEEAVADELSIAEAKGLRLRAVDSTAIVMTDREMAVTMLRNLVGNAVKYTNRGRVLIGCRRRGDWLAVEVYDTGIGIPEDKLARIFDEFYQLDGKNSGLGLGLSIVKRTADMLGHRLELRSAPGRGSRFTVLMPLAPVRLAAPRSRIA
jgi:signal transduction histidine kinase